MSATPPQSHTPTGATKPGRPGLSWWQAGGLAAVVTTLANLAVLLAGRAAGGSFAIDEGGGETHEVTALVVAQFSAIPIVVGFGTAVLLALVWSGVLRLAQVVGAVLALATIAGPVTSDVDVVTQVALSVMHVIPGVAIVWALEVVRRRNVSATTS
ncbi:DUF6069 family protein [Halostreptopolyspora alba]|uniref:Uncharacterized protein n=1 Tax=Halostreptopolyspora alba TaxID=2487137 RepID=A0A3N0E3P7_9ACTN|nr:hypothetical protein EFW17_19365 [Nocardiopsaceae bacterium YIM 96095]